MLLHHILVCMTYPIISLLHITTASESGQLHQTLQKELQRYATRMGRSAVETNGRYHRSRNTHSRPTHHRSKRSDHDTRHAYVTGTGVGNREELLLGGVAPINGTALNITASAWEYFTLSDNLEYLACIQPSNQRVEVFHLNVSSETPLTSIFYYSVNATNIEVFHIIDIGRAGLITIEASYLTIASETDGVILLDIGNDFEVIKTLDIQGVSDLEAFHIDSGTYLVITQAPYDESTDVSSLIYAWSTLYSTLELFQTLDTDEITRVSSFSIGRSTYIAFSEGSDSQSYVYKYDSRINTFTLYQSFEVYAASSVTYISAYYEHYLAFIIPSESKTVFYQWEVRSFSEFQELDTPMATSWTALQPPNCQGGTLLLLTSSLPSPNTLKMYHYSFDSLNFLHQETYDVLDVDNSTLGAQSAVVLSSESNQLYVMIDFNVTDASFIDQSSILLVTTSLIPIPGPFQQEVLGLEEDIVHLTKLIDAYEAEKNETVIRLADAVTLTGNQNITYIRLLGETIMNGTVTIKELTFRGNSSVDIPPGSNGQLDKLLDQLANQTEILQETSGQLDNAVTLNTVQTITAHKTFSSVSVEKTLTTNDLDADMINEESIITLDSEAVRLDLEQTIYGSITFTKDVSMTSDLSVAGTINGLDVEVDAVLTNKDQTIEGSKTFGNDVSVTEDIVVTDYTRVNGLDISEEVVTLEGNYELTGQIVFQDIVTISGDIITPSTVDGVDVSELAPDVMTIDDDQTISGNVTFGSPVTFDTDVVVSGVINGHDLSEVEKRALKIDEDSEVLGKKAFEGVVRIDNNLDINGALDDVIWPEDVLTIRGDHTITGVKTFTGSVTVTAAISVTGTVDGLDLSEDVVTLTGDHEVVGYKSFPAGISVDADVYVETTVDGVDISELALIIMTLSTDQTVEGPVTFEDEVKFLGDVAVDGTVDGANLPFIYEDAVYKIDETKQIITAEKTFLAPVDVEPWVRLEIYGLVNGYNMTHDFMDKITDQVVTGAKNFPDGFSVVDMAVDGLIEGVNLLKLYRESVLSWRDAEIDGRKVFLSNVDIERDLVMMVTSTVAGFDISDDFMMTNRRQTVTGTKYFDSIHVQQQLSSVNMNIMETLNGGNWTNFLLNRITLSTDQVINGQHVLANKTHVFGDIVVDGTVNGYNLTWLESRVLYKSVKQTITGNYAFDGTCPPDWYPYGEFCYYVNGNPGYTYDQAALECVDLGATLTSILDQDEQDFVDGITVDVEEYLWIGGNDKTTEGTYVWEDGNTFSYSNWNTNQPDNFATIEHCVHLIIADGYHGKWNDWLCTYRAGYVCKMRSDMIATFIEGDVTCDEYMDGWNITELNERAMFVDKPDAVIGTKTFTEDVLIMGDLTLDGLLATVNITFLMGDAVYENRGPQYVVADKTFTLGFTADLDVIVSEFVNEIDLSEEMLTISTEQEISGSYTFSKDVTVNGNFEVQGTINDIDIRVLNATVMRTNEAQVITSTLTFVQDVYIEAGNVPVSGFVDTVNLTDLRLNAVMLDEAFDVTGNLTFNAPVTFRGAIDVTGYVHGLDFALWASRVVTINTEQTLPNSVTFAGAVTLSSGMTVTDSITTVTVFGIDFVAFVADAVTLAGEQTISGSKTFTGAIVIEGNIIVTGSVDGIKVATDVVTLDGDQDIDGLKTFSRINVGGNIVLSGLVNGIDVAATAADTFMTDSPSDFLAKKTFQQTLTVQGDMTVDGLVDGIDLDVESVTLDTDQVVDGSKTFEDGMIIIGHVFVVPDTATNICGVSLTDMNNARVSLTGVENIESSSITFTGHVTFEQDVITNTLVNGVDLHGLVQFQDLIIEDVEEKSEKLSWLLQQQCLKIDELQTLFNYVLSEVGFLEEIQSFPVNGQSFESFTIDGDQYIALARSDDGEGDMCTDGIVYQWNQGQMEFAETERIATIGSKNWHSFSIGSDVYLATVNSVTTSCNNDIGCPTGWQGHNEFCYYVDDQASLTYEEARVACVGLGGTLTSVQDQGEQDFLTDITAAIDEFLWIGLNDIVTEGTFVWEDANPYIFNNWNPPNPDNFGNEDCIHFLNDMGVPNNLNGLWNDWGCGNRIGYICKKHREVTNTIYKYNGASFELMQDIPSGTNEIDTATIGADTFLAVANTQNGESMGISTIYMYNQQSEQFVSNQEINIGDASALKFCTIGDIQLLIFTALDSEFASVYIYDPETQQFSLSHTIEISLAVDISCFEYQNQAGLILANQGHYTRNGDIDLGAELIVYIWSTEIGEFVYLSLIPIQDVSDVEAFQIGGHLYIAAVSQYKSLQLFKYQGVTFINILRQAISGITSIEVYTHLDNLYLAVGTMPDPEEEDSVAVNPLILDGNAIGQAVAQVEDLCSDSWTDPVFQPSSNGINDEDNG